MIHYEGKNYLSVREVSKLVAVPENGLRQKVREGKIPAMAGAGGHIYIAEDLVPSIKARPTEPLAPVLKPYVPRKNKQRTPKAPKLTFTVLPPQDVV